MYFDTLKVSSVEQSASQTSARGGLGNPELIIWDFNKEIAVKLEDALYSPASQSLMWGGLFGIDKHKIHGAWDPCVYKKDRYGKPIYLEKIVITEEEYNNLTEDEQKNYLEFVCPCDDTIKYITYTPAEYKYKYASITKYKDGTTDTEPRQENGKFLGEDYKYEKDNIFIPVKENDIIPRMYTCDYMSRRPAKPERAELIVDNFGDFNFESIKFVEDGDYLVPEVIELCNKALGIKSKNCEGKPDQLDYFWNNADLKMTSLEGDQDIYCIKNASVRYRTSMDSIDKTVMIAEKGLYDEEGNEIKTFSDIDIIEDGITYVQKYGNYDSTIDFYLNVKWTIPNKYGRDIHHFTKILIGTFYVIDSLNHSNSITDMIHPINYGIEDVYYMDRMEKCIATHTFAINTDRNTRMQAYSELPQYSQSELTVYINPNTMKPFEANADHFHRRNGSIVYGSLCIIKKDSIYYKWTRSKAPKNSTLGRRIVIDAHHFPGAFRLVGETYARARADFQDQRYQFEIPLCKMSSNVNLNLEAAGEPTTFNMEMKVLRSSDGSMMKLTQYDVRQSIYDGYCSGSHEIVPTEILSVDNNYPEYEGSGEEVVLTGIRIVRPLPETVYCVPGDCGAPYGDGQGHGISPAYLDVSTDNVEEEDEARDKIIIEATYSDGHTELLDAESIDVIDITIGGDI